MTATSSVRARPARTARAASREDRSTGYRICTRCIMDTTDPDIEFDEKGVCNHCRSMEEQVRRIVDPDPARLEAVVQQIKESGRNRRYDCVMGVSGGTDSTYVAYLAKQLGLRPLAVHLDNGWNSELAVKNIENVLNKLGIDLVTHVLDWEEFRDLQVAFLKASTPDSEVPTDHAIMAVLLKTARREGVRHIVSGANMRTEGILPLRWAYGAYDWRYIRSVHKQFGDLRLRGFPHFSLTERAVNLLIRRLRVVHVLNYVDYRKEDAADLLEREMNWRRYGTKHGESVYTHFLQTYILPRKFGIDKRKAHLSALIVSDLLSREEALREIASPPCPEERARADREYVVKKLGLSDAQFEEIMNLPPRTYRDYSTYAPLVARLQPLLTKAKARGFLPRRVGM